MSVHSKDSRISELRKVIYCCIMQEVVKTNIMEKIKISLGWIISAAGTLLLALIVLVFILNKNAFSEEVGRLEAKIAELESVRAPEPEVPTFQDFEAIDAFVGDLRDMITPEYLNYNENNFVYITTPDHDDIVYAEPLVFEGVVSKNTEKIVVSALVIGQDGLIYNALYDIKSFTPGDQEFTYSAKTEWKNLIKGTNNYQFTAYFKDGSSKSTSVTVYYK